MPLWNRAHLHGPTQVLRGDTRAGLSPAARRTVLATMGDGKAATRSPHRVVFVRTDEATHAEVIEIAARREMTVNAWAEEAFRLALEDDRRLAAA